jgi:conjugative relaxase-like TrwC/TraI family protein
MFACGPGVVRGKSASSRAVRGWSGRASGWGLIGRTTDATGSRSRDGGALGAGVLVIATVRVLGLSIADAPGLVGAVRRLVAYLQGTPAGTDPAPGRDGLAGYYDRGGRAGDRAAGVAGWARGSAAGLVGLSGRVDATQLERLLTGRHARSGRALLPATGSAGRANPRRLAGGRLAAVMTVEQAAAVVGVSAGYLRRLARAGTETDPVGLTVAADRRPAGRPAADRLRAWRDEASRQWLVRGEEVARFAAARVPPAVVVGFDLVCSPPKSVSLLWAFGDDRLRADIAAALDAAVHATLAYLERHGAVGTVDGANRPGLGLAAASYRHDVSRADEAHLHVHNVIVNAVAVPVLDADGRPVLDGRGVGRVEWRALDGEVLLGQVKTAGHVGAAVLRRELALRRGLRWGPVRNGVADLAGFPRELLGAFSTRRGQVLEEFAQLVDAGFTPGGATLAAAQRASRAPKRVLADAQITAIQNARLATTGWTPQHLLDLATPIARRPAAPGEDEIDALFTWLAGPVGLTGRAPTFGRREMVQAVASWAGDRLAAEGIEAVAGRFLADPRTVLLGTTGRRRRSQPEPTYTTVDLLAAERRLLDLCATGARTPTRLGVPGPVVAAAITAAGADLPHGLSDEQEALVRRLLADAGGLVRPVIGPAGTGKTEAMRAVVHALTATGHRVVGTANGGRQAEELHHRLHIPTKVVTGWLTQHHHATDPAQVWPAGTVLIVDEATQVSTRDADHLLAHAAATGTVTILVGDPAQLGSVGTGGWFTHLTTPPDTPRLTVNQRQRGPALAPLRAALADLRSPASTDHALDQLAADNRITVHGSREELLTAVVTDWYADRTHYSGGKLDDQPRMLAEHHRDTAALNHAARTLLAADGTLTGPAITTAAGREFRAGDQVITLTQTGHTLTPTGTPADYVRTGAIGIITAVHPDTGSLTAWFPGKGTVHIGRDYLHYSFPDGRDGGLDHAYAITAHKAEGATLPVTRTLTTDDTSRAGLYVMLTRARHNTHAYLTHRTTLNRYPDDEDWLPHLDPNTGPLAQLADNLATGHPAQPVTTTHPTPVTAHRHHAGHTLADLTHQRRGFPPGSAHARRLRHAERAAETAIAATAPDNPPPELLPRIGLRPPHGPDRHTWDTAISALAVYHARWRLPGPPHQLGPEPARGPDDDARDRWYEHRRTAEHVTTTWADHLEPDLRDAFWTSRQAVPRQRATTGIHALLDHGHPADQITTDLTTRDLTDVWTPAAVLDHRVTALLTAHGIDAAGYEIPPPSSQHADWDHATRLLQAAEINHLTHQPTPVLHAQHRHYRDTEPDHRVLLTAALDRQIDHAAAHAAHQPASYLTALLGDRPTNPTEASTWDEHTVAIEHHRHHNLGLPYDAAADRPTAPPRRQAFGHDADELRYPAIPRPTLDLGIDP